MTSSANQIELLRSILENILRPDRLDSHPWTKSLIVQQAAADMPALQEKSPGQQLVLTIGKLFTQMQPPTAPRHGKRLDTRWGEFGILAAQYFAPFLYGKTVPASLREAWAQIDQSILLFVYGKTEDTLSEAEKEPYKLVGNEFGVAPNSTLSDWHRKGLQRLYDAILSQESYLSNAISKPVVIAQNTQPEGSPLKASKPRAARIIRLTALLLGILVVGVLIFGGIRGVQINKQARIVWRDAVQIRSLLSTTGPKMDQVKQAGPALSTLRLDFETLNNEAGPFLWMGSWLKWIPVYGGDLASAKDLMNMTEALLVSADISYKAAAPLLGGNGSTGLSPTKLTEILIQAQPQFIEADRQLNLARAARNHLVMEGLTSEVRDPILKYVDPLMTLLGDGLKVAEQLPILMGATGEGPKTYLLLVENEDELRPTGGFVTAVGTLLMQNGRISSMSYENEDNPYDNPLIDWSKPYPAAPWQLQRYMNSQVLLLRDTSWFTNYPDTALFAETLFSYAKGYSVNGVFAFDQQFLVKILNATGPVQMEGMPYLIDSGNVIAYMRSEKRPDIPSFISKGFIQKLANVMVAKVFSGEIPPDSLISALMDALNEHHLLLKFDNPTMTAILARQHWDGKVRPEEGDFLMVADTNIGFNKTNAVVQSNLIYDVDLTRPASPIGTLIVVHKNNAAGVICKQWDKIFATGEDQYPITDCYWNYMRVYMVGGTKLVSATPQFIPANWMLIKQDVPAQVDILDEGIDGVQTFGTLQVIPGGESAVTSFTFALPDSVIRSTSGQSVYHLLVQKQPGTLAVPIIIRVHLPNKALVQKVPDGAIVQGQNILYQTNLRTDLECEVVYSIP